MTSVLYDVPGPRAKGRNVAISVVFFVLLALVLWWVWQVLEDKGQLTGAMWKPFTESQAWTTYLLPGLGNTLKAAALSMLIALPLGAVLGIARLSDHRSVRVVAGTIVEFFRGIPVLMMMIFASAMYVKYTGISSEDRPLYAIISGLVLYNASVLAEVVRAGILSLPKGQSEAAKALGLRKGQVMSGILLPQAVTVMLPAIVSQLVVIVKDTALGSAILTYTELLGSSKTLAANYANVIPSLVVVALIYILVNFALTSFASWLERYLRRSKRTTGATLAPAGPAGPTTPQDAGGGGGGA
jgi:glutamate transport system permease protein